MALRLITTRNKCHLVLNAKNFRTCLDVSKINSQELLRNLSVWMNQAPKGFEKFQRDRKRGAAAKKEPPKESKPHIPPPPSKSTSGQEKQGFSFKFEIPSSGGGGGGSKKGGMPGGESQEELLKKAGLALMVVMGMYYLHVQVRIQKISSKFDTYCFHEVFFIKGTL